MNAPSSLTSLTYLAKPGSSCNSNMRRTSMPSVIKPPGSPSSQRKGGQPATRPRRGSAMAALSTNSPIRTRPLPRRMRRFSMPTVSSTSFDSGLVYVCPDLQTNLTGRVRRRVKRAKSHDESSASTNSNSNRWNSSEKGDTPPQHQLHQPTSTRPILTAKADATDAPRKPRRKPRGGRRGEMKRHPSMPDLFQKKATGGEGAPRMPSRECSTDMPLRQPVESISVAPKRPSRSNSDGDKVVALAKSAARQTSSSTKAQYDPATGSTTTTTTTKKSSTKASDQQNVLGGYWEWYNAMDGDRGALKQHQMTTQQNKSNSADVSSSSTPLECSHAHVGSLNSCPTAA